MNRTFKARRRFGQNFLVDRGAARRIVDALAPRPGEPVLEIGPGTGALTATLVERAGRIAAVELDRDLAAALERRFPAESLLLIRDDVLRLSLREVAARLGAGEGASLAVVGNLPYNISKPVAQLLVAQRANVARAVLMFQREVARRLTARAGARDYGPLAVLVGLAYEVATEFDVAPGAFRPRPSIVSTVTRWTPRPDRRWLDRHEGALRECLRAAFAHRRRMLHNNLRLALGDEASADALLQGAALEGTLRPGAIPPVGFMGLAERWPEPEATAS